MVNFIQSSIYVCVQQRTSIMKERCEKIVERAWNWRVALAFTSVSALLLALSVRTGSLVTSTFCVGRTHFQRVFTHLRIYEWTAFKRQVVEVTVHDCCSILGVRF